MLYTFRNLFDLLFPPSADDLLLRECSPAKFLIYFEVGTFNSIIYLSRYHEPIIKAAITECKFANNDKAARLLAELLSKWLETLPVAKTVLLPIPLSSKRKQTRGYNQVEKILSYCKLPAENFTVANNWLHRSIDTKAQSGLDKIQRQSNIKNAFVVSDNFKKELFEVERIIILDDVVTTGATVSEAKATLLPHLPPHLTLTCVALAH